MHSLMLSLGEWIEMIKMEINCCFEKRLLGDNGRREECLSAAGGWQGREVKKKKKEKKDIGRALSLPTLEIHIE